MQSYQPQSDLQYLDDYDVELRRDIEKAEKNLLVNANDAYHTALECRRFAERLADAIGRRANPKIVRRKEYPAEDLHKYLLRLEEAQIITGWVASYLRQVRQTGKGVHVEVPIVLEQAKKAVQQCKRLAAWFDETSAKRANESTTITSSRLEPDRRNKQDNVYTFPEGAAGRSSGSSAGGGSVPIGDTVDHISQNTEITGKAASPTRAFSGVVILCLLLGCGIAGYAIYSANLVTNRATSNGQPGAFATPQSFVVTPGGSFSHANARTSPSTDSEVKEVLSRGMHVTGIGWARDANGANWIQLSDNRGYVKETVLRPATTNFNEPNTNNLLSEAEAYLQANNLQAALQKVKEAQFVPNQSEADTYRVNKVLAQVSLLMNDRTMAAQAYVVLAESSALPLADQSKVLREAVLLTYDAKFYQKTIAYSERLEALGASDDKISEKHAAASYSTGDYIHAKEAAQKLVDVAISTGQTPTQVALAVVLNATQAEHPNSSAAIAAVRQLCQYYPDDHTCRDSHY